MFTTELLLSVFLGLINTCGNRNAQDISRVSGNLLGMGIGFPNTSLVLMGHRYNELHKIPQAMLVHMGSEVADSPAVFRFIFVMTLPIE